MGLCERWLGRWPGVCSVCARLLQGSPLSLFLFCRANCPESGGGGAGNRIASCFLMTRQAPQSRTGKHKAD